MNINMTRTLPACSLLLVIALTLTSGIIYGRMTYRWGKPVELVAAGEKLADIPSRFGSWRLESSNTVSDTVINMLQCTGYIYRTYVNEETGETVSVAIFVGPSGQIAVHTPEVCFPSRDSKLRDERQTVTLGDSNDEFWAATFQLTGLDGGLIRVYWAWSTGGPWCAPEDPRFSHSKYLYLYKIQLTSHLPFGTDFQQTDPCRDFLQEFVSAARRHLVTPPD